MNFFRISVIFALSGVALGAMGAHALHDQLVANGSEATWKTAALYQLVHALALFSLCNSSQWLTSRPAHFAKVFWTIGIVLFSGSLYGLALSKWPLLGPITPIGGVLLMIGWICLLFANQRKAS